MHQVNALKGPINHMQPKQQGIVNVGPQLFHSSRSSQSPSAQQEVESPTVSLEPLTMPPQLATTLEHIVGQLDILTQVQIM